MLILRMISESHDLKLALELLFSKSGIDIFSFSLTISATSDSTWIADSDALLPLLFGVPSIPPCLSGVALGMMRVMKIQQKLAEFGNKKKLLTFWCFWNTIVG